jgi:hypothetical protein
MQKKDIWCIVQGLEIYLTMAAVHALTFALFGSTTGSIRSSTVQHHFQPKEMCSFSPTPQAYTHEDK